jgi:anti-anti-sigma factor
MSVLASAGPRTDRVVITVGVPGRFDGSTVALVRQALAAVIDESSADVTIDLGADWIDMPALAVLAHAHRRLRAENRRLVVCASSDRVRRVLAVTGLSRVIWVQPHTRHLVA